MGRRIPHDTRGMNVLYGSPPTMSRVDPFDPAGAADPLDDPGGSALARTVDAARVAEHRKARESEESRQVEVEQLERLVGRLRKAAMDAFVKRDDEAADLLRDAADALEATIQLLRSDFR